MGDDLTPLAKACGFSGSNDPIKQRHAPRHLPLCPIDREMRKTPPTHDMYFPFTLHCTTTLRNNSVETKDKGWPSHGSCLGTASEFKKRGRNACDRID